MDSLGQFIRDSLQAAGFDGLCNPEQECGCPLDDLFTCGEPSIEDCYPAYFRNKIASCSCMADTGPDPCLCTRHLEWWEKRGFAHEPIDYFAQGSKDIEPGWNGPGFYFWDKTWANMVGPFPTYNMAQAELFDYCETILGEPK